MGDGAGAMIAIVATIAHKLRYIVIIETSVWMLIFKEIVYGVRSNPAPLRLPRACAHALPHGAAAQLVQALRRHQLLQAQFFVALDFYARATLDAWCFFIGFYRTGNVKVQMKISEPLALTAAELRCVHAPSKPR